MTMMQKQGLKHSGDKQGKAYCTSQVNDKS